MTTFTEQERMTNQSQRDKAETMLRNVDRTTSSAMGTSLFHVLTLASIALSIALFMSGRKLEAIFVGLWPPTFEALKAAGGNR